MVHLRLEKISGSSGTMNKDCFDVLSTVEDPLGWAGSKAEDPHRASCLLWTFLQKMCLSVSLSPGWNNLQRDAQLFVRLYHLQEKTTELQQAGVRSPQRIFLLAPFKPLPLGRGKRGACQKVWDYRLTGKTYFLKIFNQVLDLKETPGYWNKGIS